MPLSFTAEQKLQWLWLALGALFLTLLILIGPVLTPFIAAAILAYALNPAVDWLDRRGIGRWTLPRTAAVTTVMLVLIALILGILLVVLPVMQKEIGLMRAQIPGLLTRLNTALAPRLHDLGLNITLDVAGLQKLLTQQLATSGEEIWTAVLSSAKVGGMAVLGWLLTFGLIPVVLFYLLLDWHALLRRIGEAVPRRWVGRVHSLANEVNHLLAQYLRGQLAVMLALMVYYSAALFAVGLDTALPIGLITGSLCFIPYIGFGLGLVLALLAALLQYDTLQGLILVSAVYGVGQVLESFVLTPRLVGERIGLHPLIVIFALMAFGQLLGFVGVLLALPMSAILSVAYKHLRNLYVDSDFYKQAEPKKIQINKE
jgi:predicted PurR-regulated permease PerM